MKDQLSYRPFAAHAYLKTNSYMINSIITYSGHFFTLVTQSLHICYKLFPNKWLSAGLADNLKSRILNGKRLSCLTRDVVHLMMSYTNKWHELKLWAITETTCDNL